MATYSNLKKGGSNSKEEVQRLQQALISAGYDLGSYGADGVYGAKTDAAVRQYQQATGLKVDGIAGAKTQGALYGGGTAPVQPAVATSPSPAVSWQPTPGALEAQYTPARTSPAYTPSPELTGIWDQVKAYQAQKPGEYKGSYDEQIKALLDKVESREKFSYDPSEDPLYDIYRDQYTAAGKLAMQDSMGNAAALTGGYGSSYGQQVGQQTYQGYMRDLTAKIPELAQAAYQQYQAEGADMFERIGLYQNLDAAEYAKYAASLDDYYNQLGVYMNQYNLLSNEELARYQADLAAYQADRDYQYAVSQAARDQANWEAQFAYQREQDALSQANWAAEFGFSKQQAAAKAGGGPSSGSSGNGDYTLQEAITAISTIMAEGNDRTAVNRAVNAMYNNKLISSSVKKELEKYITEIYYKRSGNYK